MDFDCDLILFREYLDLLVVRNNLDLDHCLLDLELVFDRRRDLAVDLLRLEL